MRRRKEQEGFTFPEVLIALFVLTVALLAMGTMVLSVMRATSQSKEMATAATLMQDKTESLRNLNFASLTAGSDSVVIGGVSYNRQWSISSGGNFKTITVAVNWEDGVPHTVSATTLRGE